jgi:dipeptidase E
MPRRRHDGLTYTVLTYADCLSTIELRWLVSCLQMFSEEIHITVAPSGVAAVVIGAVDFHRHFAPKIGSLRELVRRNLAYNGFDISRYLFHVLKINTKRIGAASIVQAKMKQRRQIIALGGGGFSRSNFSPKMSAYILESSGRATPKICFISTASGDDPAAIEHFYRMAKRLGARPSHLALFQQPREPLASYVARHDIVYVGGGNTRNMLILWRAWGLDAILRSAYDRGVVLAGSSAGALCWFGSGVTDSFPGKYAELRCLGWLSGSFCPHFDSEPKRKPVYRALVRSGRLPAGYAADDFVGLHYIAEKLEFVVSTKRAARAHRLQRRRGKLVETLIVPELL